VPVALIVDDNDGNRKLVRDLLRVAGFRTLEAATGADAIGLASEHAPNVVLMDLRLPDIGGADAARRLGNDERTAAIPVVALSALSLEGNEDWLRAAGFAGWIEKPIRVATFAEQVREYCSDATH
jgi:two-component system, cell cycle response regulator DivK